MDYGHIISRGWNITWNNKWLWILGFLAGLTSSRSSSNFQSNFNGSDFQSVSPEKLAAASGVILGLVCLGFMVYIILALVSLVARGGLITAVDKLNRNEETSLGEAFSAGVAKIWTLVGMSILVYLPVILVVFVVAILVGISFAGAIGTAVAADGSGGSFDPAAVQSMVAGFGLAFVCLMMVLCLLVIVALFLRFINAYAYRGIMLYDMGAVESISHGWQVFKQNAGDSLLLAILFFFISLGYGIVVGILLLPFVFVVFAPLWGNFISGDFGPLAMGYGFVSLLCLGIVAAILSSILVSWQSASFTLAYRQFVKKLGMAEA